MTLELNGLVVDCILGDLPHEREKPQSIYVDAALEIDSPATLTDKLSDTVDYAALAEEITRALVDAKCRMLERAAKIIADVCLAHPMVNAVNIGVSKHNSVPNLTSARVRYEEKR